MAITNFNHSIFNSQIVHSRLTHATVDCVDLPWFRDIANRGMKKAVPHRFYSASEQPSVFSLIFLLHILNHHIKHRFCNVLKLHPVFFLDRFAYRSHSLQNTDR